jgi:glutamine synthetase
MSLMHDYKAPATIQAKPKRRAMYIWMDGQKPTAKLRSKSKILDAGQEPPIWGFDGSSTEQALGTHSDCVLVPVFSCVDSVLEEDETLGDSLLVLCEVFLPDGSAHPSNTRALLREAVEKYGSKKPLFGIEQEYTFMDGNLPYSWPAKGEPAPQGGYYCGVGADEALGRNVVEDHLHSCLKSGLCIAGTNAEVMPGQWEFQVGPLSPLEVSDHLWMARWLLYRVSEKYGISATLHQKPMRGDWNGAGCHTNYSTAEMRADGGYDAIIAACEAIGHNIEQHIENYGDGLEERLTGRHETCKVTEFKYGVSNRAASIRIPWQVDKDKKGYLEDRRPNANMDPYRVTRVILETTCG